MNKKIELVFCLILVLTSVFAVSTINDFNINLGETYTNSTEVTLNYNLDIDTNCEICFSENNDPALCSTKSVCEGNSLSFTLSSENKEKTLIEHLTPEEEAAKKKFEAFKK